MWPQGEGAKMPIKMAVCGREIQIYDNEYCWFECEYFQWKGGLTYWCSFFKKILTPGPLAVGMTMYHKRCKKCLNGGEHEI